jgi:hypothetical protein
MTSSPLVRLSAIAAPVLLFLYGSFRLIDGLDGHHDRGFLWNAGHTMFFIAFALLGALAVGVWSPVAVLVAFIGIAVNLDLIPLSAILLLAGLLPLASPRFKRGSQPAVG